MTTLQGREKFVAGPRIGQSPEQHVAFVLYNLHKFDLSEDATLDQLTREFLPFTEGMYPHEAFIPERFVLLKFLTRRFNISHADYAPMISAKKKGLIPSKYDSIFVSTIKLLRIDESTALAIWDILTQATSSDYQPKVQFANTEHTFKSMADFCEYIENYFIEKITTDHFGGVKQPYIYYLMFARGYLHCS